MNIRMPILIMSVCGVLWPSHSEARFKEYCVKCHTMHNSQGGVSMVSSTYGSGTLKPSLLKTNCVGCHIGTNTAFSETVYTPYVLTTSGVDYGSTGTAGNTLAGGNFWWVASNPTYDPKGHNVVGIRGGTSGTTDTSHGTQPPGSPVEVTDQLTCAGTNGCHGNRTVDDEVMSIHGAHHSPTQAITGNSVASSYRWLSGITGLEDADWEYQPDATNHNQYHGDDRSADTNADTTTMSSFCAKCHGDFHNGGGAGEGIAESTFASPWIRHPVDYDMQPLSGEYASFNKQGGVNTYSVAVPLASTNVTAVKSTVRQAAGDAIIMCLSCHRAHGSPFNSILRWDYQGWPAAGYNGCNVCHTSKD